MSAHEKYSNVMRKVNINSFAPAETLQAMIGELALPNDLVFVCIGTDRSTGDALGPLTGSRLKASLNNPVYGTLDEPVHAVNLDETLKKIELEHPGKPIFAIDACLGKSENIGNINVCVGQLKPGSGVNKVLSPVGDYHIAANVNVGGFMENLVLQNTRLSLVTKMANAIATALIATMKSRPMTINDEAIAELAYTR